MDKFWRAEAIVRAEAGALVSIHPPEPATETQIQRVHSVAYLDQIRHHSLERAAAVRLGLPPGPGLLNRSALEVGGTLAAAQAALSDGLACNLAGGTHHAFADRGLGYCVLNDVAIAVREMHVTSPHTRFMVIDTDAHQGNGTNGIFQHDPQVFTYSIHVGKTIPPKKPQALLTCRCPATFRVMPTSNNSRPLCLRLSVRFRPTSFSGSPARTFTMPIDLAK